MTAGRIAGTTSEPRRSGRRRYPSCTFPVYTRTAVVGIDTPSIDYGQSTDFETHVVLYGANIPGLENVANLGALPETGSFVVALPMKIEGGSGGPVRIVAFIPGP